MPVRRWLVILSVALLTIVSASYLAKPLHAAGKFQPVSPAELAMTSEPEAPGAAAIILFREVDRDDRGLTAHEDNYVRIKILKEEGRSQADVEIPFSKGQGNKIANIGARTIRPDGTIVNFDGRVFEKSIVKAKGFNYMAKTFTLTDVQVGSVIEYYYTVDLAEHWLFDSRWVLSSELFTKDAIFTLKPYAGDYQQFDLRWRWNTLPPGAAPPAQGPDHVIRMEARNIPAFQTEDFMPPENELKSRVDFTYSKDAVETDVNKFWKKKGKQLNDSMEGFVGKRRAMEGELAGIIAPTDPPTVKLQKLYSRVQQIRNTSYEVEKTEQEQKREKEKDASNADDVWKRGYGTAKELTWLYLAMARAAGIEAYGVAVSDRSNYFFQVNVMDSSQLDRYVVLAKVNGKDIFADPGAQFTPFGLLPWSETGVPGLRLDKDGGSWIQTVVPDSSQSQIVRTAAFTLADTGDLEGKLTVTFTGLEAMRRRVEERNQDESDRKKFLEDQVRECIPAASEVDLTNHPDWTSSSPEMVAEYTVKIPGWVSGAGHRGLFPTGIFGASERNVFDHTERVHPIYFEFPFEKHDDIAVTLPAGWQVGSVPAPQDYDGKLVIYTANAEGGHGTMHLSRNVMINVMLVHQSTYPALRKFFQAIRTGDDEQVVLQAGSSSASN